MVSGTDDGAHSFTLGHTWVISSAMVNSFRVVGNDITIGKPGPEFFGPQDVGINAYTYVPGYTTVRVLNGFNVGGGKFTTNVTGGTTNYGVSNDFTVVRGNHQIGFGGYYLAARPPRCPTRGRLARTCSPASSPVSRWRISSPAASAPTGRRAPIPLNVEQNFAGAYVQDTWRIIASR